MPLRHKSAQKRARQTVKITERNKKTKALIKGAVNRVLAETDKTKAVAELKKVTQSLDRAATKGVLHKNKASNTKSKLAKHINKIAQ